MKFTKLLPRYASEGGAIRMQGSFTGNELYDVPDEEAVSSQKLDPLQLDIDDDELIRIVDDHTEDYKTYYTEKYDLFNRREKNEIFVFGRQVMQKEKEKTMKDYESRFMDNVLYEIEGTIKPLAMSRIPDLMALPGNDNEQSVLMSQEIGKALDSQGKEYETRFTLGLASKHFPVYFLSCIKTWWDPELDDMRFEVVHPDLIEVDHHCNTKNADDMDFVSQICPMTVQQIILKFPKAKEEFYLQLKKDGLLPGDNPSWSLLATQINIREVWFTYYKRHEDDEVETIDAVLWKYKDVILLKMKNPNFDYEGESRFFAYDEAGNKATRRGLNDQELAQILMTGQPPDHVKQEQVYHNYFRKPRKPFYFMGYDQWGKQPMDETSRIEQNLQNQKSLDRRGKQIEETLDSRGHHIMSKQAVTPAELEELDFDEPNVDLSVEGRPSEVYSYIPPERPTKEEFEELGNTRERMYAVAHSNAVRGEISQTTATNTQIGRESDFTAADDLVEDTINPAAQWMAEWRMQFIKLRYTQDHFFWLMGIAGKMVYQKLNRNMIEDGMLVKIKASGTDKLRAQNNSLEMAKLELTDPYTFYVDMGLSDPEGRTERIILAKMDPTAYLHKVVQGLDTSKALAEALANAEMPTQPVFPSQSPTPGAPPAPGQPPAAPQQPTPTNTAQVPAQPPPGPPAGSPRTM